MNAKFSLLGEELTDPADPEQAVAENCALATAIGDNAELDASMGVKPTRPRLNPTAFPRPGRGGDQQHCIARSMLS